MALPNILVEIIVKAALPKNGRIVRLQTTDPRMAQIVKRSGQVCLAGQVPVIETLESSDIAEQTRQTLSKIDTLLVEAGTDKSKLLTAKIWLKDIAEDFNAMNEVWNAWLDPNNKPTRACVESPMARPSILVEILIVA